MNNKVKKRMVQHGYLLAKPLLFGLLLIGGLLQPVYANQGSFNGRSPEIQDGVATIGVKGMVKDKGGMPIPGVNVVVKGTTNGTITDFDGNFKLDVPSNAVLTVSFIGYKSAEISVNNQRVLNIVLQEESISVDEVVVTAMGIRQEKKKLNFAVQSINPEDMMAARPINFVQSLQGNIAGATLNVAGGSPNAGSQIILRGVSSINGGQGNEPLFVLDGSPISGGASGAAAINPNLIENVTVLKGAAASALYGQDGANGVILITTKSGKAGETIVTFNSTIQMDQVANLPEIQNKYLRGGNGVYNEQSMGGWGPLAPIGTKTYNNAENFLETGLYQKYDMSVSGGSEKFTSLISGSYEKHQGVVINDDLDRWNLVLKTNFVVNDKLTLNLSANVINSGSRGSGQLMSPVYAWPIDDDMSNYKNSDGSIRWLYVANNKFDSPMNPYWRRLEDWGKSKSQKNIIQGSVVYLPVAGLNLTGRFSYENLNSESESSITPRWPLQNGESANAINNEYLGQYWYGDGFSDRLTLTMLSTYERQLTENLKMSLLVGGEIFRGTGRSAQFGGYQFFVPGWISMNNIDSFNKADIGLGHSERNKVGIFGEARLEYKGVAHISLTNRNDISSTLPKKNRSYYYPSITGGIVFTEFVKIPQGIMNYGKLRGNWAKVGKDAPAYQLDKYYRTLPLPDGGYGVDPTVGTNVDLKPEMASSWEIGADLRFFKDKTRFDFAYYHTKVSNQIVTVRVSPATGMILQTRNEGDLSNKGVEVTYDQRILKRKSYAWDMTFNFSKNIGYVSYLPDQIRELYGPQMGDIRGASIRRGPALGLVGKDYLRTHSGDLICDENGRPKIDPSTSQIGNREPDFKLSWINKVNYKNLSLTFMFEGRKGGDVANGTFRSLLSNGQAKVLEDYRNREILIKGVVEQPDGSYLPNSKPVIYDQRFVNDYVASVSSNFIEDGSYIRLSYVTLSYKLDRVVKNLGVKGLTVSASGKNLLLLTKYSGSDPMVSLTGTAGGAGDAGMDNMNVPSVRSYSISVSANF
ncbi:MAG: SusC/RagA family TonB-linked outer membrane protein [Breznakibacter sp.]